jgi:hypothetical protein
MGWLQKIAEKTWDKLKTCPSCFALHDKRYVYTGYCTNCGESMEEKEEEKDE